MSCHDLCRSARGLHFADMALWLVIADPGARPVFDVLRHRVLDDGLSDLGYTFRRVSRNPFSFHNVRCDGFASREYESRVCVESASRSSKGWGSE